MKTENNVKDVQQFVTFRMNGKVYAIHIMFVKEINRISFLTRVPNVEPFVDGVMNLRGAIIPVINVRRRFQMEAKPYTRKNKLIIVEYEKSSVGLIVDEISEVVKISTENIENEKEKMGEIGMEYVMGLGKTDDGILPIINIHQLLKRERGKSATI